MVNRAFCLASRFGVGGYVRSSENPNVSYRQPLAANLNQQPMRQIIIISLFLQFLFCYKTVLGQIDMNCISECYKIQFILKNSTPPDSTILPVFQRHGFHLIENGVYDFVINGKKYYQSYLLKIGNSSFSISQNWAFENGNLRLADTLNFSSSDKIEIRMVSIDNNRAGLPFKVGKDYNISFIKSDKLCKMKCAYIDTNIEFDGLYYFTDFGWKKIKMKKGKPYFCEATGQFQLRRK